MSEIKELYDRGNEVARRARQETPRINVIREVLPGLTEEEMRVLDENIENAIRDEVVRTLQERGADSEQGQEQNE